MTTEATTEPGTQLNDRGLPGFGMSLHIDLAACDPDVIRDKGQLHRIVLGLIAEVHMTPYGPMLTHEFGPRTEFEPKFGEGDLYGQTIAQMLTTSDAVMHVVDADGSAHLDLFSCRSFDPEAAIDYLLSQLKTTRDMVTYHVLERTAPRRR